MHRGYIALYRKIQDHPFYTERRVFSKYEAWIDILMEVQHKLEETKTVIGMNVITCGHGQSIKSLRTWAARWGWTAKKVSRFFILLEKMGQICHENVTVTTRITVLNYSKYDIKCHGDVTDVTQNGNTSDTRSTHDCPTDNNDKNENNDNHENNNDKYSDEIINFTKSYQGYVAGEFPKTAPDINGKLIEKCCDAIDKLIRIDGFTFDEIYKSIQWSSADAFWCDQILSLANLRKKAKNGSTKFVNMYTAFKKNDKPQLNKAEKRLINNINNTRGFLDG